MALAQHPSQRLQQLILTPHYENHARGAMHCALFASMNYLKTLTAQLEHPCYTIKVSVLNPHLNNVRTASAKSHEGGINAF